MKGKSRDLKIMSLNIFMYQSIPSLTIPRGNSRETVLKGRIPHPRGTKKVGNPDPWGRKFLQKPHPGQSFSKIQPKNNKT